MVQDAAVVLGRVEYSEASQIITLCTRAHGKVRVIAKGIKRGTKKRYATGVDLLEVGEVTFIARREAAAGLSTMTEWRQTRTLSGLREKLFRIHAGQYAAEVTAHLTEDWDPHPGLYDALVGCLEALAEADGHLEPTVAYLRNLLTAIGSWPVFHACVRCGAVGDSPHFSSLEGGLICDSCGPAQPEKRRVRPQTVHLLRGDAGAEATEGGFALLNYHIAHLMGREPLLARHLLAPERRKTGG